MIHDPTIDLLEAAVNFDPNPNKGDHEMELAGGIALLPHGDIPEGEVGALDSKASSPNKTGIAIYTVKKGDSLSEIAEEYGVSTKTILWANDIRDASTIGIGDELIILPVTGVQHKVVRGETLQSIAKKYGSDVTDIALYNGISESKGLIAGSEIIVPGGAFPSASPKSVASTGSSKKSTASAKSSSTSSSSGKFGNPLPGGAITQANHGYNAVDIDGETGDPIYASAGGTVLVAKGSGWNGGYGNYVVIEHGGGAQTLYAHMSNVAASGSVSKGDVIGYVGNTGKSTGSHLHFEVRGASNPL
ncbi:MAG: putative membrane bound lytic murein transglycosylase B [Parcubacteria bacterium C7867-001]|nr:MAG: putative membrane bound lytic murein transglycosylase B [Parcubacteria bacterium C7867-001]